MSESCCNVNPMYCIGYGINESENKGGGILQYMHTVQETNEELATPIYSDKACKMGKEWDFNWHLLYQFFSHKYFEVSI